MKIITDERCAGYATHAHPERPERVLKTLELLRAQTQLPLAWAKPVAVAESPFSEQVTAAF